MKPKPVKFGKPFVLNPNATYPAVVLPMSGKMYRVYGRKPADVGRASLPKRGGPRVISPGWKARLNEGTVIVERADAKTATIRIVWAVDGGPVSFQVIKGVDVRNGSALSPGEAARDAWRIALDLEAEACPFRALNTRKPAEDVRELVQLDVGNDIGDPAKAAQQEIRRLERELKALRAEVGDSKPRKKAANKAPESEPPAAGLFAG